MDLQQQRRLAQLLYSPFDPRVNTPRDLGFGGQSTEYTMTIPAPNGGEMLVPSIWWDQSGDPYVMNDVASRNRALEYEQATGKAFPRFSTPGAADDFARQRSMQGGGMSGSLAR